MEAHYFADKKIHLCIFSCIYSDFGDEKVEQLTEHFGAVIEKSNVHLNKDQMLTEWIGLKIAIYSR